MKSDTCKRVRRKVTPVVRQPFWAVLMPHGKSIRNTGIGVPGLFKQRREARTFAEPHDWIVKVVVSNNMLCVKQESKKG